MKVGTVIQIGNSVGVIIPRSALRELGWWPGDKLVQEVKENEFTLRNVALIGVKPTHIRRSYGDRKR